MRILALFLLLGSASAHELQDNRATLVLRDRSHLSLTLYLAYTEALHEALAPSRPMPEFLFLYSSMPEADLQRELGRAQAKFQSETRLVATSSGPLALTNWVWPPAKQVQALLRQRVMEAIASPDAHTHEEPLEIHADAMAAGDVAAVRVQFPEEFRNVLVVAFRPSQQWVEPKSLSPAIRF